MAHYKFLYFILFFSILHFTCAQTASKKKLNAQLRTEEQQTKKKEKKANNKISKALIAIYLKIPIHGHSVIQFSIFFMLDGCTALVNFLFIHRPSHLVCPFLFTLIFFVVSFFAFSCFSFPLIRVCSVASLSVANCSFVDSLKFAISWFKKERKTENSKNS